MISRKQQRIWKLLLLVSLAVSTALLVGAIAAAPPYLGISASMWSAFVCTPSHIRVIGYTRDIGEDIVTMIGCYGYPFLPPPIAPGVRYTHPAWYAAWLIFQLAVVSIGFGLLIRKGWRLLPPADHLNIAFGYLAVSWLSLVAFRLKRWYDGLESAQNLVDVWNVLVMNVGFAILLAYLWLRWNRVSAPEETFP